MTKCKFQESFFRSESLAIIEFQINHKKKCQKNVRNYCVLKIKQYICKVNKAQTKNKTT